MLICSNKATSKKTYTKILEILGENQIKYFTHGTKDDYSSSKKYVAKGIYILGSQ